MNSTLAINGGKPAIPASIEKRKWPVVTQEDKDMVMQVLDSGILGGAKAPQVKALESEFAQYLGVNYCIAMNSGTAALHAALVAAGVGPGDEVITSAYTFLASAVAVVHNNGIPVFADIDPHTFNINPEEIEKKITDHTKAIIPVHIEGLPADMDRINEIARKYNLVVIEDSCQAHGAEYKGKKAGTLGSMAAFSLNFTKNLPGGEGGLFVTDSEEYKDKAEMVRMFGEIVREEKPRDYISYSLGWNYRTQEMPAALTRSQLRRLDYYNKKAQENAEILSSALKKIPGIEPRVIPQDRTCIYHKYRVRLRPDELGFEKEDHRQFRNKVGAALAAEGISVVLWYEFPLPANPLFQKKQGYGKGCPWTCPNARPVIYKPEEYPVTKQLLDNSLVIGAQEYPLYVQDKELMECYIEGITKVFARMDEVVATVKPGQFKGSWADEARLMDTI